MLLPTAIILKFSGEGGRRKRSRNIKNYVTKDQLIGPGNHSLIMMNGEFGGNGCDVY
jgi:hypothetical protein